MKIDGHTRVCGLMGDPVEHTSSPAIHNTLAGYFGHDLVYVPFHVKRGDCAGAVEGAYKLNILGMNVTVPHKIDVMKECVSLDSLAESLGAVNTLVRTEGGFKGYNTDILGLERALLEDIPSFENETVVLLGAGGAARACAFLMARLGAGRLYILNRTADKAVSLAGEVNAFAGRELAVGKDLTGYRDIEEDTFMALQATSIGLSPNDDCAVIENDDFYRHVKYAFDLVYRPADTRFMKLVRKNSPGAVTRNGLKMLLYQGVIAYELWNDVQVTDEAAALALKALEETVRA